MYLGLSVGDLDGDAGLDIALTSDLAVDVSCSGGVECAYLEYPDDLLHNNGGLSFSLTEASYSDAGSRSMTGLLADRDNTEEEDLFVPKEYLSEKRIRISGALFSSPPSTPAAPPSPCALSPAYLLGARLAFLGSREP